MDVNKIVLDFLKQNGYDGLYNPDSECACLVSDLAPCDEMTDSCEAGYKTDGCTCGEECDFHINARKEVPDAQDSDN